MTTGLQRSLSKTQKKFMKILGENYGFGVLRLSKDGEYIAIMIKMCKELITDLYPEYF